MSQTLNLDKRQRAMLREMGVRVWQPLSPVSALPVVPVVPVVPVLSVVSVTSPAKPNVRAPDTGPSLVAARQPLATNARISSPDGIDLPAAANLQPPSPQRSEWRTDSRVASWSVGPALALYAQATPAPGPRWLVLAETAAAAVQPDGTAADTLFNPFEGDAGKLLDNMLRAVRLHKTGSVMLAPLVRRVDVEAAPDPGFSATLATLVQTAQPDVVLVMGRLAAQALLQSSEPFGKLRGHLHTLYGVHTVVTHDAAYVLRSPLEKARAWEDLCLALSVL